MLAFHEVFEAQLRRICIQTVFDLFIVPVERENKNKNKNRKGSTALEVWL